MSAVVSPTKNLRVLDLEVSNFCRIEGTVRIPANGNHVRIHGPNESGKTSFSEAFWQLTTGADKGAVSEPIHHGAEKAYVKATIGGKEAEYILKRTWTAKRSTVEVLNADGSKPKEPPQKFLEGLLSARCLRPSLFLAERDEKRVQDILDVCGVKPPVGEVMTLTKERHDAKPDESAYAYLDRLFGDGRGVYYDRRKQAKAVEEQKRHALEEEQKALTRAGGPVDPAAPGNSTSDETLNEIERLQQKADERKELKDQAYSARQEHAELVRKLGTVESQLESVGLEIQEIDRAIEALQGKRKAHEEASARLSDRIFVGRQTVAEADAEARAKEEAASKLKDPLPRIMELRQEVQRSAQAQQGIIKRQVLGQRVAEMEKSQKAAQAEWEKVNRLLEGGRAIRQHLLDDVDLGVKGLEIIDGELRLSGAPWLQASKARQIVAAVAIAKKQNPQLKTIWLDEAEALDDTALAALEEDAVADGFQVITTRVSSSGPFGFEVVDGEAA